MSKIDEVIRLLKGLELYHSSPGMCAGLPAIRDDIEWLINVATEAKKGSPRESIAKLEKVKEGVNGICNLAAIMEREVGTLYLEELGEFLRNCQSVDGSIDEAIAALKIIGTRREFPAVLTHAGERPATTQPEPRYWVQRTEPGGLDRRLAVDTVGADDGVPVMFMHGMPGSRSGPYPRGVLLRRFGVRLIAYDRPGYGGSTRHEGRSVADAAEDVRAIADHLGIDRFAVAGRSGGGPHALAVAAKLPDRVTAAAVLVSFAPQGDARGEMFSRNVGTFALAKAGEERLLADLAVTAEHTVVDPEYFFDKWLRGGLSPSDHRVLNNVAIRRQLRASYAEALCNGASGWVDDLIALHRPWGFQLGEVAAPTFLWHGAEDRFSPVDNTRWLAGQLDHPEVDVDPHVGHFGAVEALPKVLSWLVDRHHEAVGSIYNQ
jgi:pimeloyl-ACP methyl ester carboxylesterase